MDGERGDGSLRALYEATACAYAEWAGTEIGPATETAHDRAVLAGFADSVAGHPAGVVADVGCGPGRVAAFLEHRGQPVVAFDLSTEMVRIGQQAHPTVGFGVARLAELPVADGSLAGVVSWYSIIHTPPHELHGTFVELGRVLAPGGRVLVAFQSGHGQVVDRPEAHGTPYTLRSYRHALADVVEPLAHAGFTITASATREPELAHESASQSFVVGRC